MPSFPTPELPALLLAVSFSAGLNVYATVATLGLLARAQVLVLPPGLHPVASWYVIGACIALFLLEFFADKIPAFDLVWNALHTFVRIPIAALLVWGATTQLSPGMQLLAAVLGGAVALAAHGGKMAARLAVTPSPEPFSNIGLSLGEDGLAIFLTWFATQHPNIGAAIVLVALLLAVFAVRLIIRALRSLFRGAERQMTSASGTSAS
jgi:hypothetical protein